MWLHDNPARDDTDAFILRTKRLVLRPVLARDAEALAGLMTARIAANLLSWPRSLSPSVALERIVASQRERLERAAIELAILIATTGDLAGLIRIGRMADCPTKGTIGFWLGEDFQGVELMPEAALAAIPAAMPQLGLTTLEACVCPHNKAGRRLVLKLGFRPAGLASLYSPVRKRWEIANRFELDPSQLLS